MNEFTLSKNKELLWQLLCDNKNFVKMIKKDVKDTQNIFEKQANELISVSTGKNVTLLTLNKDFLKNMNNYCNKVTDNVETIKINNTNEIITRKDIQQKELNSFDERLSKRQQDFDKYGNEKPTEINFIDENKDGPLTDIDNILKTKIAERNYEVQNVDFNNSKEETEKWLGVNIDQKDNDTNDIQDIQNIQKIHNIHNNPENIEVSIDELQLSDNNIFSKLKTETPNMDRNIISKLDLIIENQNTILELLKKNNK